MFLFSSDFVSLLQSFAPLFDSRVWSYAQLLLVGAMLAPGKRTVTSVLRIVGRGNEQHFQNYHRVLNRARWNSRAASQILLSLLIRTLAPSGPILVGWTIPSSGAGANRFKRAASIAIRCAAPVRTL
jgi:DDE superfamily endonuclease